MRSVLENKFGACEKLVICAKL